MEKTKKTTRHQNRVEAIQILFNIDLNKVSKEEAISAYYDSKDSNLNAINYVEKVLERKDEIDSIIENNLTNYKLDRLNVVDKAIIRLATLELLLKETPTAIVINEALNLTREFSDLGDNKMVKFTNSLLDKIAKNI